jgi:hypothetical protein
VSTAVVLTTLADAGLLLAVRSAGALASVTPEPAEVVDTPEPELVTPGTIGFIVTFGVAVATVLLIRDMVRRVRRVEFEQERRAAELLDETTRPDEPVTPGEDLDGDGERPAEPNG